jgi:hypothetical protein
VAGIVATGGEDKGPTPSASVTVTPSGAALAYVTQLRFTATPVNLDVASLTYDWSFGDGARSTEAQPTHVYQRSGTHQVQVTVKDGRGRTATGSLAVTAKMIDGQWEPNQGGVPDSFNCTQDQFSVYCQNPILDTTDLTTGAQTVWGTLSQPLELASTWRFEDGVTLACNGSLDQNLQEYWCTTPLEGYRFQLRRK